jgi:hypothetical protein
MLAACTKGKNGNLLQLRSSTAFKLTFEESVHKCHSVGSCWFTRAYYNTPNIITEYPIVFLREKFFEFIAVIMEETLFSILVENIAPFSAGTKEFSFFLDKFNLQTGL